MSNGKPIPLRSRLEGGKTPKMTKWYLKSETGPLRDVLLGPAESFRWMGLENAHWSSLVRDTLRKGYKFDKQVAMRQHREMVDAYHDAGVTTHFLPLDMNNPYQVYARDSSFMSPYGAVICQLANPRRRGEYAAALRFYLENDIPIYDMISAGNFEGGDFNTIRGGCAGGLHRSRYKVAARQPPHVARKLGNQFAPSTSSSPHRLSLHAEQNCAAVARTKRTMLHV